MIILTKHQYASLAIASDKSRSRDQYVVNCDDREDDRIYLILYLRWYDLLLIDLMESDSENEFVDATEFIESNTALSGSKGLVLNNAYHYFVTNSA